MQQPGPRPAGCCAHSLPPLAGVSPDPDSPQLPSPKKTALRTVVAVFSHQVVSAPCLTPGTAARQAPLSIAFLRQEYWSGCHIFLQGIFQTQGPSPHLLLGRQFFATQAPGKPRSCLISEAPERKLRRTREGPARATPSAGARGAAGTGVGLLRSASASSAYRGLGTEGSCHTESPRGEGMAARANGKGQRAPAWAEQSVSWGALT